MKKVFIAIFALVYMSTSVGATVQMHFCMGKLAHWGFVSNESKTCSKCGMEKFPKKDNGCCKDEHTFIKNDIDQKTTETAFQMAHAIAVALPISFFEIPAAEITTFTKQTANNHAPPQSNGVAVYIRNCVFLI